VHLRLLDLSNCAMEAPLCCCLARALLRLRNLLQVTRHVMRDV